MSRTILLLILTLAIIISTSAYGYETEEVIAAKEITTEINLNAKINLTEKGPMYSIDLVRANLYNYPSSDANQQVLETKTTPEAQDKGDHLRFEWRAPKQKTLNYHLTSTVKTENTQNPIKQKINYPIRAQLERGYDTFLKPTQYIDSTDPTIKTKAKELTQGEDDLYIAVSKIADWVNKEVDYNLSTRTEKVTQKASWVLEHKTGVCDEITSLFIALLRASDIPARFVSGAAYKNNNGQKETWELHGWAEVYYPERGWLPYDITFGEYGWIDPGHIKLKETLDPRDRPTKYEWQGRDAGLESEAMQIDAKIISLHGNAEPMIEIKTTAAKKQTGPNSYNLITAEVKNLKDQYVTREIVLAGVKELEITGQKKKLAILKPNETKKLYWRIKTSNFEKGYAYEIPIETYTLLNEAGKTQFSARQDYPSYTLTEIATIQDQIDKGTYAEQKELISETNTEKTDEKATETKKELTETEQKEPELEEEQNIMQKIIKWIRRLF